MSLQVTYNFKDKVALVTGAAKGMGLSTSIAFARAGAAIVMVDMDFEVLQSEADKIIKNGGKALAIKCDVSNEDQVAVMIEQVVSTYGKLDMAYNNAGVNSMEKKVADLTRADYDRIISINQNGIWLSMQYEIRQMLKQGHGSIVNCSSLAGHVGAAGRAPYSASKYAVIGMTKSAALEYATSGIRVNAISPGMFETPMADYITEGNKEVLKEMTKAAPIGRLGQPEEIAEAVLWLCSDASSYVTATTLAVDGGYLAQ
jgi:Dehydrogenases with different specificities (related to short-chain alcohol dehydrogenases)